MADRPKALSAENIFKIISNAIDRGAVLPSNHFRRRMRERNFDMQDTLIVLEARKRIKAVWNDIATRGTTTWKATISMETS